MENQEESTVDDWLLSDRKVMQQYIKRQRMWVMWWKPLLQALVLVPIVWAFVYAYLAIMPAIVK